MIFPIPMRKLAIVLAMSLFALFGGVMPALAQHVPEHTPRPGERRFNTNIFKASHNAYERDESYAEQLDDMNSWGLELDIQWIGNQFFVAHRSCSTDKPLSGQLPLVAQSATWRDKVTVLWFEVNNDGDCHLPSPDVYEANLKSLIDQVFDWSRVYTPTDFFTDTSGDNGRWPSWQEMVRRGKNLIIVIERNKHGLPHFPHPYNKWFFEVTYEWPTGIPKDGDPDWQKNVAFYNADGNGNFSFDKGDYWGSRLWPSPRCSSVLEDEDDWHKHVKSGATIVATNCLSDHWTQASTRVHPPQPTFVNNAAEGAQYGTQRFPYGMWSGLVKAMQRTAMYGTSTEIQISPGDYIITGANPATLKNPMVFKAPLGGVVIR